MTLIYGFMNVGKILTGVGKVAEVCDSDIEWLYEKSVLARRLLCAKQSSLT